MASISDSGIACAALILALALSGPASAEPEPIAADLEIAVTGLRSAKGQILVCVTRNAKAFPDCSKDAGAQRLAVAAGQAGSILVKGLAPGAWAVSLVHDENRNAKMDMALVMPKEGFGFSRDPKIGFGPPKFASAAVTLVPGANRQTIRMKYML